MFDSSLQKIRGLVGMAERQEELSARVARLTPFDGAHQTALPFLAMSRGSVPTACMPMVYHPCLAIVVQGRKRALLNGEVFNYDALNYLVVSVTIPGMGQVVEATPERPYLSLKLNLDLKQIASLVLEMGDRAPAPATSDRGLFVARLDEPLLDAVLRMVKLLDTPEDLDVLAPVVQREILYRMLRGELGYRLVDLAQSEGGNHRIVRAIDWLQQHFAAPLRIEELADTVHMSPSALHHRFKAVTAMSPLQYQKHLRLHEARRLMFSDGIESATAGHRVGYESASQFTREYRRLFGAPPRSEIARLRETGMSA